MKVYLAGPMSGYPMYNFPMFDSYRNYLLLRGYEVISPADLDRAAGWDPEKHPANPPDARDCAKRDVEAICKCDAIFVMPGYKDSRGCTMELAVAKFIGIPVHELDSLHKIHLDIHLTDISAAINSSSELL